MQSQIQNLQNNQNDNGDKPNPQNNQGDNGGEQQDETTDWQIYQNAEYGIEFKYPADKIVVFTERDITAWLKERYEFAQSQSGTAITPDMTIWLLTTDYKMPTAGINQQWLNQAIGKEGYILQTNKENIGDSEAYTALGSKILEGKKIFVIPQTSRVLLIGTTASSSEALFDFSQITKTLKIASLLNKPSLAHWKEYIQISIAYECGKKYNIYRSLYPNRDFQKILQADFKINANGSCGGGEIIDDSFPKNAEKLYYKYTLLDNTNHEIQESEIAEIQL